VELYQSARYIINQNARLQCCFGFPVQFKEVKSLADSEKPRCCSYDLKFDQSNKEEFLHDLIV